MNYLENALAIIAEQRKLFEKPYTTQADLDNLISLTSSYDGYQREDAVRKLGILDSSATIPVLLLRLNDWVPQVREAAKRALSGKITDQHAAAITALLPEIFQLKKRQRHNSGDLIDEVIRLLVSDKNRAYLINSICDKNQKLSTIAFKLCREYKLLSDIDLLNMALKSRNPVSMRDSLPLIDQLGDDEFFLILGSLIKQKFKPILIKTIKRLETFNPALIGEMAEKLLYCNNSELRRLGRHYLALPDSEAEILYYNCLINPASRLSVVNISLIELASFRKLNFSDTLMDYTKHQAPKIRKTALQQLAKLIGEEIKPMLLEGLLDKNSCIKNESARLLIKHQINLTDNQLVELYRRNPGQPLLNTIFLLAKKNGKWTRLSVLLNLLPEHQSNPLITQQINYEIRQWNCHYNSSSAMPSKAEINALKAMIMKSHSLLTTENQATLKFLFDTLGD